MALYDFACDGCGPFEVARPMAEASDPASCPSCGREGRRVFNPPQLGLLAQPMRRALDAEEKSAHEPKVTSKKHGCAMHHHHHGATPPWALSH